MYPQKLKHSLKNKVFTGVCAGIGEYFGVAPLWIRILVIAIAIIFKWYFLTFMVYIAASIFLPAKE